MATSHTDVAVVGGGLCGLLTAALLASSGCSVTVLDARQVLGGRARTTEHHGFRLNLGPRAFYRGPARRALRRLGIRPTGGPPPLRKAAALFEGHLHPGFMTARGLATSSLLAHRDRGALARMLGFARVQPDLAALTATEWLDDTLPSKRSRLAAGALIRLATYVGALDSISADAVGGHLATARFGVRYLDHGWQSVVDALHQLATRSGVSVRLGGRVETVDSDGGSHLLTLTDGQTVTAHAVVIAGMSPERAAALLDWPALARRAGPPVRAGCLDIALRKLPDPGHQFIYGIDEPLYLSVHSAHARLGPPGGAVIHLVRYDDGTPLSALDTRRRLESLLDSYQPGWREYLIHSRYLPRMIVTYGLPTAGEGLSGRADIAVPGRAGVFLAGDWVGRVGLLAEATAASAVRAADAAERHLEASR